MYDARNTYKTSDAELENSINKRATLTLTGTIVESGQSDAGSYVKFLIDERWGFPPGFKMVMDLEAFELSELEG